MVSAAAHQGESKTMIINYPQVSEWDEQIRLWAQLKAEYGAEGLEARLAEIDAILQEQLALLRSLPEDTARAAAEPDDLEATRAQRPPGRRRIWTALPEEGFAERLAGALMGRFAGCTLGSPVELWSTAEMARWADHIGDVFPPEDYWSQVPEPHRKKYEVSLHADFARGALRSVPTDDDIIYTQLGLLILEEYGRNFTTEQVGEAWLRYLPYAFTAEHVALENLRSGVTAHESGERGNPFCQFIGADIRADPWGYAAAGWPERAAEMAYRDAYLSHRRNGVYGAMYFAAAIAAAFTVDDPVDALHIGLEEIPGDCWLAREVRWALDIAPQIGDYQDAVRMAENRYGRMNPIHTVNNACLTVWGVTIGGRDFTKIIGQTVAMGHDNDCTAATAGSIAGAALGLDAIPTHWWRPFNNCARSYITGHSEFAIDDMQHRFTHQAAAMHAEG